MTTTPATPAKQYSQATLASVPWTSRRRRFLANIAALEKHNPQFANLPALWETAQHRYQLYQAPDANLFASDSQIPPPQSPFLGGLIDHQATRAAWTYQRQGMQALAPCIFDGAAYGWLLTHVLETTRETFLSYSCPIYLLEPDPDTLCILLHAQDLRAPIESGRLRIFTGPNAVADFQTALRDKPDWGIPTTLLSNRLTPRPALPMQQIIAQAQASRAADHAKLKTQVHAFYQNKSLAHWAATFQNALAGTQPLKVLGITTRYSTVLQYSMRELGAAIRAAGHHFILSIEADDHSMERPDLRLLAQHQPDLIVQISRMRHENPNLPQHIPFLCWDQDNLPCMRTPEATASLNPFTYVAGYGALHGLTYLNWPINQSLPCQLAGSTHRYAPRQLTPDELTKYTCDFGYLSNAAQTPQAMRDQQAARFAADARMLTLYNAVADTVLAQDDPQGLSWSQTTLDQLVAEKARAISHPFPTPLLHEVRQSALLLADRNLRHQTLQWVSDYCRSHNKSLKIYGAGWEKHPTLAPHAAGAALQGDQIQAITQATRINLQIIGTGILHSRFLDGLAAGGFFLFRKTLNEMELQPGFLAARATVSAYLKNHPVETLSDLDAITDPTFAAAWKIIRWSYHPGGPTAGEDPRAVVRGLIAAHDLPHALTAFPNLSSIGFSSPEEFATLADRYLQNDALRAASAENFRTIVEEKFSYDARWKYFLESITHALVAASNP